MTKESRKHIYLFIAWLIALSSLLASWYASDIRLLPVCHLCWYQRICFYPLSLILFIALLRDDLGIAIYTLPLASIGVLFATYQFLLQMFPKFAPLDFCGIGPSCRDIHLQLFGFVTIPFLSVLAGTAMIIFLVLSYQQHPKTG